MDWDTRKIEELAQIIAAYDLTEVEIKNGEDSISVKKAPAAVQMIPGFQGFPAPGIPPRVNNGFQRIAEKKAKLDELDNAKAAPREEAAEKPAVVRQTPNNKYLVSPMAGIFYRQSQPGNPPYVEVGQRVRKGDKVCLVEAMKMINEISADRDGIVKAFLAENEQFVECGTPLVLIEEE